MQDKKKIILDALAKTLQTLRNKQSQFMLASENDISVSIISMVERGLKDPQLTTMFKLAEACNMKLSDFITQIEKELPQNFSLIDK